MKPIHSGSKRERCAVVTQLFFLTLLGAMLSASFLPAQQSGSEQTAIDDRQGGDALSAMTMRVSELVGQQVKNRQNEAIAEIDDLIVERSGRIQYVIVSVGGLLGVADKLVALDFDDLQFERRWSYRTIRTQDGTEKKVAWERRQAVIFEDGKDELLNKPDYAYPEKHLRGGPTGWGIYSHPAGPKSIEEVPSVLK
jgi:hypothetical protein